MKVVHIATIDEGGAYKAADRIYQCMKREDVESILLLRTKKRVWNNGEIVLNSVKEKCVSKVKNVLNLLCSSGEITSDYIGTDIIKFEPVKSADIIIFHWVNSFITPNEVAKLMKMGKRVVWVMHDMWLFTGGCHVDDFCGKYENGCIECPLITNRLYRRIPERNVLQKRNFLANSSIKIVGPSNWLVNCAKKSLALQGLDIRTIANPIDIKFFKPIQNKSLLRKKYGISVKKKVLLMGAVRANEKNKGIVEFLKIFNFLNIDEIEIVIFGNWNIKNEVINRKNVKLLGTIEREEILLEIYNLADVFVAPSKQESFGYTVCEAMSCGIPVSAYANGGYQEQIEHRKNGYLAEIGEPYDLAQGIKFCLENSKELGKEARKSVIQKYSYSVIGEQYYDLVNSE